MENDLLNASSPADAAAILRRVADRYEADALELASAWQDANAGKAWLKLAERLRKVADQTEADWKRT